MLVGSCGCAAQRLACGVCVCVCVRRKWLGVLHLDELHCAFLFVCLCARAFQQNQRHHEGISVDKKGNVYRGQVSLSGFFWLCVCA